MVVSWLLCHSLLCIIWKATRTAWPLPAKRMWWQEPWVWPPRPCTDLSQWVPGRQDGSGFASSKMKDVQCLTLLYDVEVNFKTKNLTLFKKSILTCANKDCKTVLFFFFQQNLLALAVTSSSSDLILRENRNLLCLKWWLKLYSRTGRKMSDLVQK